MQNVVYLYTRIVFRNREESATITCSGEWMNLKNTIIVNEETQIQNITDYMIPQIWNIKKTKLHRGSVLVIFCSRCRKQMRMKDLAGHGNVLKLDCAANYTMYVCSN